MKVTLTALNAPNLPLATAYRPHRAVARQRDRGHDSLRTVPQANLQLTDLNTGPATPDRQA
ncbi:hypothetical protein LWC34_12700 [Kibdelosporangium philippinense]|uniref:Uncharacterized protein n=1 Tax=Kibdelosporangium philippinense TaxID=211113 RepID=A0ABS8Z722_9PSEU|nr:hypothetical protein [Kibdelosporangium philippinense]MCE7003679.1 hypothetical protein [Kibdelosporangium philippinense]